MSDYLTDLVAKREALQKKVRQGRAVKTLKENAPDVFELIDIEITLGLNKMTQPTPLDDREYLSTHGYVKGLQKARDVLNSAATEEVSAAEQAKATDEQIQSVAK